MANVDPLPHVERAFIGPNQPKWDNILHNAQNKLDTNAYQSSYKPPAPKRVKLIGLNGLKQSGKNTVAGMIQYYVKGAVEDAFADPLKVSALAALGLFEQGYSNHEIVAVADSLKMHARISVYSGDAELVNISFREYLQYYGTESHRDLFGDSFWVDLLIKKYQESDAPLFIVTDCRFENEALAIRAAGGQVWHVNRPGNDTGDTHASEKPLPSNLIDWHIENDGTLEELSVQVLNILNHEGYDIVVAPSFGSKEEPVEVTQNEFDYGIIPSLNEEEQEMLVETGVITRGYLDKALGRV
jgi:hypothetical protein